MNGYQIGVPPLTPMVKRLAIINISIWFVFIIFIQKWFLQTEFFYIWFSLIPNDVLQNFLVWQPLTYMFLHSDNVMHIVFNLLLLWFMGGELEKAWGSKFFLFYYLGCGIGAAIIYILGVTIYALLTQDLAQLRQPVVGASGAIFGLILAYGLIYGERIVYFFMIFPMKAKYFVLILGAIELMNLMSAGFGNQVSNLAHLGGILAGYFILRLYPRIRDFYMRRRGGSGHGRKLKLVIDNETRPPGRHPRYWN